MADARIFQRIKSTMQSGRGRTGQWVLEYVQTEPKRPDPLTGWAGSGDTRSQVQLHFPTLEAAQAYARAHGLTARVIPAPPRMPKIRTYAENFR